MSGHATTPEGRGLARSAGLVLLALLVLAPPMLGRELTPPDEPRFALIAREMANSGELVVLSRGGEVYVDKPPLLFWGQVLSFRVFGESEAAARVPSLLATLLTVALLHRAGRRWVGEPRASAAALVFMTMPLTLHFGAWVSCDALLVATTFGMLSYAERARAGGRGDALVAGAFGGLALLAKGPVVLVFLALLLAAEALTARRGLAPTGARSPLFWLGFLVLALPWPIAWGLRRGFGELARIALEQNVGRYVDSWDNIAPWYDHVPTLLFGVFSWAPLLLLLCWPTSARRVFTRPAMLHAALLVLLALIFFSLPEGKRGVYLYPAYPFLALLFAGLLFELPARRGPARGVAAGYLALALLFAAALGLVVLAPGALLKDYLFEDALIRGTILTLLALMAATSLAGAAFAWRRSPKLALAPLALALGLALLAPPLVTPAVNAVQRGEELARLAERLVPKDAELAFSETKWEVMAWYIEDEGPWLRSPEEIVRHLAGPGTRALIARQRELPPPSAWPEGTERRGTARLAGIEVDVLVREEGRKARQRWPAQLEGESEAAR